MQDSRVKDYLNYSKWMFAGWLLGLLVGWLLDAFFDFGSPFLEGLSRFVVGYGDTIGAGLGLLLSRIRTAQKSTAEIFWVGTAVGTLVGPLLHLVFLWLGYNTASFWGALVAVAYSNSDNWGGVLAAFIETKRGRSLRGAWIELYKDKFVVANVVALLALLALAFGVRLAGFAPASYLSTSIEGALLDNDSALAILIFIFWLRQKSPSRD